MCRDHRLGFHVHILGAIEARWTARTDAVGPQCLNRLLLENLIRNQIIKVVGGEVRHGSPVREFRLWSGWSGNAVSRKCSALVVCHQHQELSPYNHRSFLVLGLLKGSLGRNEGFGGPKLHPLIDLLGRGESISTW